MGVTRTTLGPVVYIYVHDAYSADADADAAAR